MPTVSSSSKKSPKRKSPKKSEAKVAIRKDPIKEFRDLISDSGVAEVVALSDDECVANLSQRVSTQSIALDKVLGGGIPLGRVLEMFGPPHIGKSTLADHICAAVQQIDGIAVVFDTEISRDVKYSAAIGVDVDKLQYVQLTGENATIENVMQRILETVDFFSKSYPDTPVVVVWDSLGGTATKDEIDKGLDGMRDPDKKGNPRLVKPGAAAKAMRSASRQLSARLGGSKIAVLILNHEYETFGGFKGKETYGGGGLRHAASLRIQLHHTKGGEIQNAEGEAIGRLIAAKLVKNRTGLPNMSAKLAVIAGIGVDNLHSVFEGLKAAKIITTNSSWCSINLGGEQIKFQGIKGLQAKVAEDPDLFNKLVAVYLNVQ